MFVLLFFLLLLASIAYHKEILETEEKEEGVVGSTEVGSHGQ
jgi:hypothetical protein